MKQSNVKRRLALRQKLYDDSVRRSKMGGKEFRKPGSLNRKKGL